MALNPATKIVLDGMNNVDRALVILYIGGVDNDALAATIGDEFLKAYYPNVDIETATNNQRAKAFIQKLKDFTKDVYKGTKAQKASKVTYDDTLDDADDDFTFTELDPTNDD